VVNGAWLVVQTFRTIADLPPAVQIAAAGAVIAILAVFVLALQSGGSRSGSAGTGESGRGNPDDCWKYGVFYFNRDDHALFVPKRFGLNLGYTLNFANRWSWVVLVVSLLPAVAVILWLPHLVGRIHRGDIRTR
jgi:uncharacterized membrane protein